MIISSKKYACETCIKGHRSSSCKHTDRPLFEIKKKGRPVTQCEHCRELRKTKQVHVKCICESKAESSYFSQQGTTGFESAAFPNGLPEALGASVAFQTPGEGTSSDSDHGGVHHGHQCKSGEPCTCVTPRTRTRPRGGSTEQQLNGAAVVGSSRRTAHGHSSAKSSAHTSSQILARIQELRPLVPRPPSGMYDRGAVHNPSTGVPHSHALDRHHDFTPYGRVHGTTPQQNLHPQSYLASTGSSSAIYPPYDEQMYNVPMMNSPSSWAQRPETSGYDNAAFPSLCGCGDDCACPGCVQHNRATGVPSSSAYASCTNPNNCATCLDCTIMSLPASAFLPPNTALSISDSQTDAIDDWLRQMSSSISSTNETSSPPAFQQGFNEGAFPPQQQTPSGWNSREFSYNNQPPNLDQDRQGMPPSNSNFNSNYAQSFNGPSYDRRQGFPPQPQSQSRGHRSQGSMSSHDSQTQPMIDPRLLPSANGNMLGNGPFLTLPDHSRSRSPSTSSQSSHSDVGSVQSGGGCCNPSSSASVTPYRPSGRMQGMFPNGQNGRSAPQLNIRPGVASGPNSASSSCHSSSPASASRGRSYMSSSNPGTALSEYGPSLAGLQIH